MANPLDIMKERSMGIRNKLFKEEFIALRKEWLFDDTTPEDSLTTRWKFYLLRLGKDIAKNVEDFDDYVGKIVRKIKGIKEPEIKFKKGDDPNEILKALGSKMGRNSFMTKQWDLKSVKEKYAALYFSKIDLEEMVANALEEQGKAKGKGKAKAKEVEDISDDEGEDEDEGIVIVE